jgi:hypothetical protein
LELSENNIVSNLESKVKIKVKLQKILFIRKHKKVIDEYLKLFKRDCPDLLAFFFHNYDWNRKLYPNYFPSFIDRSLTNFNSARYILNEDNETIRSCIITTTSTDYIELQITVLCGDVNQDFKRLIECIINSCSTSEIYKIFYYCPPHQEIIDIFKSCGFVEAERYFWRGFSYARHIPKMVRMEYNTTYDETEENLNI